MLTRLRLGGFRLSDLFSHAFPKTRPGIGNAIVPRRLPYQKDACVHRTQAHCALNFWPHADSFKKS